MRLVYFVRRHPVIFGALSFFVFGLPQWLSAVYSLFKYDGAVPWLMRHHIPQLAFSPWWITAPVGILMFATVIIIQIKAPFISKGRLADLQRRRAELTSSAEIGESKHNRQPFSYPLPSSWKSDVRPKVVPPNPETHKELVPPACVTYEETDQIIEIFRNAPGVKLAITSISSKAGEEFRSVMERAGWLHEAFNKAGVRGSISLWESLGSVPDGTNIWWIKNAKNNDMAERVIRAANIKGLYPKEVQRSVSARDAEIELMIGRNPMRRT